MITSSRDIMLLPTPFHSRVEAMCDMNDWGNWMGYTTPNAYFDVELDIHMYIVSASSPRRPPSAWISRAVKFGLLLVSF